jgi:hypothetical protein
MYISKIGPDLVRLVMMHHRTSCVYSVVLGLVCLWHWSSALYLSDYAAEALHEGFRVVADFESVDAYYNLLIRTPDYYDGKVAYLDSYVGIYSVTLEYSHMHHVHRYLQLGNHSHIVPMKVTILIPHKITLYMIEDVVKLEGGHHTLSRVYLLINNKGNVVRKSTSDPDIGLYANEQ